MSAMLHKMPGASWVAGFIYVDVAHTYVYVTVYVDVAPAIDKQQTNKLTRNKRWEPCFP